MEPKLPPTPSAFDAAAQNRFTSEGAPPPADTVGADIAVLRRRIAKAEADRDTWRASGMQENYLEACSMVDSLNLQLDGLRRAAGDARSG